MVPQWIGKVLKAGAAAEAMRCIYKEHLPPGEMAMPIEAWDRFLETSLLRAETASSAALHSTAVASLHLPPPAQRLLAPAHRRSRK